MDFSKLFWTKNIRDPQGRWAYVPQRQAVDSAVSMELPEAQIFSLGWKSNQNLNAQKPQKGELIVLHQQAKVTHVVECLDNEVHQYQNSNEWIFRVVKALWIPPLGKDWSTLPHQKSFFGFEFVVMDGLAHNLLNREQMPQFHDYWDKYGGLETFQKRLKTRLANIY